MFCITTVEYSVLLNGIPGGKISPNRGLRQGDPLSPYLFILCTEVLIAKLRRAEQNGLITGISIAQASPKISHLLFADDSLFFCKATSEEASQILKILKDYEAISGQQINFSKSSIQFGHAVPDINKIHLHRTLGITQLGGMGSYLGLPENIGGAKTRVFAFVHEKLQERVNSWSSKFLSKAGKEVLIKSVLTALPTYVMSCFRLPKTVIHRLNAAIADFWWRNSEVSRGIHWKKWEKLCRSKSNGGLGFRTLEDFNTALLAKQLWRVIDFPNSLLARVMCGKYFRDQCPLSAKQVGSPSYGWRSIISARPLVSKGLIRKIGDGRSIRIWKDPWLPDVVPRPASYDCLPMFPDMMVDQFIDQLSGRWKEILVKQYFKPEDVEIILGIPIPKTTRADYWGWHFTKSGRYTVKSGYQAETAYPLQSDQQLGPNFQELLSKIWKLNCPHKIQHFLWQILSGCVAVKSNLAKRGINCDTTCSRCGTAQETIHHVLFECPPALQVWALSNIPTTPHCFPGESVWYNLDYLFWRIPETDNTQIFPWLLWNIWRARNDHCFSNNDTDARQTLEQAIIDYKEWLVARKESPDMYTPKEGPSILAKSPFIFPSTADHSFTGFKCYVDASWKNTDPRSGLGWICFPDSVVGGFMGTRGVHRSISALHAEVEAVIWAMESLLELHITEVELSTDCATVVQIFSHPEDWPAFIPYQEDFIRLVSLFSSFAISVIPRTLNSKADSLARCTRVGNPIPCL